LGKNSQSIKAVRSIETKWATPARCFITDDGYLIFNYHVVKDATKVHLVTSAGTVDAKVIQVDASNDPTSDLKE
jgi:S1-C subfamily serine protease